MERGLGRIQSSIYAVVAALLVVAEVHPCRDDHRRDRGQQVASDRRNHWSEHQPSTEEQNAFLEEHGWSEYGKWFLRVDDEHDPETKSHYRFPYGFQDVHRCAVLSAELASTSTPT